MKDVVLLSVAVVSIGCSGPGEPTVSLIQDMRIVGSGDRVIASFYGRTSEDAFETCERYRRLYASYCNWVKDVHPQCDGHNPTTLEATRCE